MDIVKSILHEKDIRDQLKDEGLLPSPALTEDSVMGKNVLDNIMENLSSFSKKGSYRHYILRSSDSHPATPRPCLLGLDSEVLTPRS